MDAPLPNMPPPDFGCFKCGAVLHNWHAGAKGWIPNGSYRRVVFVLSSGQKLVSKCCAPCLEKLGPADFDAAWQHTKIGWARSIADAGWPKERVDAYWAPYEGASIVELEVQR